MNIPPLISIITINYNHAEDTCELLDSLRKITYPNIEIFVVDNNSKQDPSIIKLQFPEIKFIQSNENRGFAGGNNLAIKQAKGDFILLINNDTIVPDYFLEPLVNKLLEDKTIGIVSPKIEFLHTPGMLQYAGMTPMNEFTVRNTVIAYGEWDKGQYETDKITAFAHGAAMMIRRSIVQKAGMMPEVYFLYYEELDWCTSISKMGYKICYVHNSKIYHKESVSTGKLSPLKVYYMNRARLIYLRRNVKGLKLFVAALFQFFIAMPKNASVFILKNQISLFKAYHKAAIWIIKHWFDSKIKGNPSL